MSGEKRSVGMILLGTNLFPTQLRISIGTCTFGRTNASYIMIYGLNGPSEERGEEVAYGVEKRVPVISHKT